MAAYTRQSVADIVNGLPVTAPPINAEFNALAAVFDATTGHLHDGSTGAAPPIPLGTSVSGYLPTANGGIGGKNKTDAVAPPAATNDVNQGYAPGSIWMDATAERVYLCSKATSGAAVWDEVARITAAGVFFPNTHDTVDLGTAAKRFRNLYLSGGLFATGNATIGGTLGVVGVLTATGGVVGNVTGNVTGNLTGNVTATSGSTTLNNLTVNGTADFTNTPLKNVSAPVAANDAANKSYVDAAVAALVDNAPGTIDTLNELAAALGDDPNFATTVSNDIATKLPKAGGTMTGDIVMGGNKVTGLAAPTTGSDAVTKQFMESLFGTTATAEESALTAEAWAETPTDTEVEPGSYSALHHAAKALLSAAAAAESATTAAGYLDEFGDLYLGQQASNPTVDNDGNPLQTGSLFWHVTEEAMKVWTGSVWRVINVTSTFPNVNNPVNATEVEMNRLVGVTGDIQTQIDGKLASGAKAADSELLDGLDSTQFLRSDQSGSVTGTLTVTGAISSDSAIIATSSVYVDAANATANTHFFLRDDANLTRGAVIWGRADDAVHLRKYLSDGSSVDNEIKVTSDRIETKSSIELHKLGSGDRSALIDLHASDGVDYSGRLIRWAGLNGTLDLQNTGTGDIRLRNTTQVEGNLHIKGGFPRLYFNETDAARGGASGHRLSAEGYDFSLVAVDSNDAYVQTEYYVDQDTAGATRHRWYIGADTAMDLQSSTLDFKGKTAIAYYDTWLRLNHGNDFTTGIYCGTSRVRTDGMFQAGNGGDTPGFNNSSDGATLHEYGQLYIGRSGVGISVSRNTGGDGDIVQFRQNGTFEGSIKVQGGAINYTSASDYRLKENLKPIEGCIDIVRYLNPTYFEWKDSGIWQEGFIAHEVQAVAPTAVSGYKDEVDADGNIIPQAMDQSKLIPYIVGGVQDVDARVTALQAENAAKDAVIADLISRVEALEAK